MKKVIVVCVTVVLISTVVGGAILFANLAESKHLENGNKYLAAGEYVSAISEFAKYISKNDENADAYYGLAQAHCGNGEYNTAVKIAEIGYEKTQNFQLYYYIDELKEKSYMAKLEEIGLPYFVKEIICAYYDLMDHEEITQDMLDSITSLTITMYDNYEEAYYEEIKTSVTEENIFYIDGYINEFPSGIYYGPIIRENRFENLYKANIKDESLCELMDSVFIEYDLDVPEMTEETRQEIINAYNCIEAFRTVRTMDFDISIDDFYAMNDAITTYVRKDMDELKPSRIIDLESLKLLPNLEEVMYYIDENIVDSYFNDIEEYRKYCEFTFENCPVPVREIIHSLDW